MSLYNSSELLRFKLKNLRSEVIQSLAGQLFASSSLNSKGLIDLLISIPISTQLVDQLIRDEYNKTITKNRAGVTFEELVTEVAKVNNYHWGTVQGQLDSLIQREYVRKYPHYGELIEQVTENLHPKITNYVVCSWYNHWTTVLLEEHIKLHPRVIPTIKSVKGIDVFFDDQPFDLKVTYLPKQYTVKDALDNPRNLAKWLYENQGAERFGDDNRLYLVLLDVENPEKSWQLKRNFKLLFQRIDEFLDTEKVTSADILSFSFKKQPYSTVTKIIIITSGDLSQVASETALLEQFNLKEV